jgi:hypothetical protein
LEELSFVCRQLVLKPYNLDEKDISIKKAVTIGLAMSSNDGTSLGSFHN